MPDLASRDCVPCKGGVAPLTPAQAQPLLDQLDDGWTIVDGHHLARSYGFSNFRLALDYVNAVGELAEAQGDTALASEVRGHLALYRAGKRYQATATPRE